MKKLADFINKPQKRPMMPMVPIDLKDNEASKRLIKHTAERVIKEHKQELVQLAYK